MMTALFPHQLILIGELFASTWVIGFTKGKSKIVKFSEPIASDVKDGANISLNVKPMSYLLGAASGFESFFFFMF